MFMEQLTNQITKSTAWNRALFSKLIFVQPTKILHFTDSTQVYYRVYEIQPMNLLLNHKIKVYNLT